MIRISSTLTILILVAHLAPLRAESRAPDLRLEWTVGSKSTRKAGPIEGAIGASIRVGYRVRNLGGQDAYSVIVRSFTALGRVGSEARLHPGPRAGGHLDGALSLRLAEGMRELCLEARLQNLKAESGPDPRPEDNRVCRKIKISRDSRDERGGPGDGSFRTLATEACE